MRAAVLVILFLGILVALAIMFPVNPVQQVPLITSTRAINGTPTPSPTATLVPLMAHTPIILMVQVQNVNMRSCASTRCKILQVVHYGDQFEWSGACENGWAKLQDGWIYAIYLAGEVCQ